MAKYHPAGPSAQSAEDKALDRFANLMIEKIQNVQNDWKQPWFSQHLSWPKNIYDGKGYDFSNSMMLLMHCEEQGYRIPVFGTFERFLSFNYSVDADGRRHQLTDSDGNPLPQVSVNKGEKSFPLYYTSFTVVNRETKEKIPYSQYKKLSTAEQEAYKVYPKRTVWPVFCVEQTNLKEARPELYQKLLDENVAKPVSMDKNDFSLPDMDLMLAEQKWFCPVELKPNSKEAYYSVSADRIVLPEKKQFYNDENFYGTAFHEMTHSTGSSERLNRLKPSAFGSADYAREELVAELGAAMVCQMYGMEKLIKEDSAPYLKSWLQGLGESPEYIKTVLGDVKRASGMITRRLDAVHDLSAAREERAAAYSAYDEYAALMCDKYGREYYDNPELLQQKLSPEENTEFETKLKAYVAAELAVKRAERTLDSASKMESLMNEDDLTPSASETEQREDGASERQMYGLRQQKTEKTADENNSVRIVSQKFAVEPGDGWIDKLDMIGEATAVSPGSNESESKNPDESWRERYDHVYSSYKGSAIVTKDGKHGLVDMTGKEFIPCQYEKVHFFSEGFAAVQRDGKWGYVDRSGNEAVPCQYTAAYDFSKGFACVSLSGKVGLLDKTGREVIPCQYDSAYPFSESLIRVSTGGKFGCVNTEGYEVLPCQYDNVFLFHNGFASVHKAGKWGIVNTAGQEVVECRYDLISKEEDGLHLVKDDGCWGYIDNQGKEIIPCQYTELSAAELAFEELKLRQNSETTQTSEDHIQQEDWRQKYDDVFPFSEGLSTVRKGDKWGYVDTSGNEAISCQYSLAGYFSEGLAAVKKDGKYGFIDSTGNEVIPCQYDDAAEFHEGLAAVEQNHKWGFINRQGETVIRPQYTLAKEFSEGLAVVNVGGPFGVWGVIDKSGQQVVPLRFSREIDSYKDGYATIEYDDGEKRYFDRSGILYRDLDTLRADSKMVSSPVSVTPKPASEAESRVSDGQADFIDARLPENSDLYSKFQEAKIANTDGPVRYSSFGDYYDNEELRQLAHGVKEGDADSIASAAHILSAAVPPGSVIVPMPSHTGHADSMLLVCQKIAEARNDVSVADILLCSPHRPLYETKLSGNKPSMADVSMSVTPGTVLNSKDNVIIIDNVIATGTTAMSANNALPSASLLTLADDTRSRKIWLDLPLAVSDAKAAAPAETETNSSALSFEERLEAAFERFDDYVCTLCQRYGENYYHDLNALEKCLTSEEQSQYSQLKSELKQFDNVAAEQEENPDAAKPDRNYTERQQRSASMGHH